MPVCVKLSVVCEGENRSNQGAWHLFATCSSLPAVCSLQSLLQDFSHVLLQALCVIMSLLQTQRAFIVELTADLCSFLKSIGTVCDHAHGCSRTMEHRTG